MNHWWYEKDGVATGPVSDSELLRLLSSGEVKTDVLVWCTGFGDWWEYSSLVAEFGDDVIEWALENMTDIKDAEDDGISDTPPPIPKTPIVSSSSTDQTAPYIPLPRKHAAPLTDFVGNNRYQKRSKRKRSVSNTAAKQREGDILPGYSKEQHDADAIEAKANIYGCLLSILFILAPFAFIYAVSYACNLISPNNKELPVYVVGLTSLVLVATYLAKKASAIAKALLGKALSMAPTLFFVVIWLVSFAYLYIGFVGVSYFIGSGWATLAMAAILILRADMALPVAVFFGANYGFGLNWVSAVAVAMPSLVVFSLFSIADIVRSFKWR